MTFVPARFRLFIGPALAIAAGMAVPTRAHAESGPTPQLAPDGVYDRFDGDLDLGLSLGAEFGSVGRVAPALRASAHYFSIAGIYVSGRINPSHGSAPSLFGAGVDLRPLFVPRWAKGYETGPDFLDLTLDSLSLSVGAFWSERASRSPDSNQGFDAELGCGLPLLATAGGPWIEVRGALRYPDGGSRQEALIVALAWHGFVTTPFSSGY